MSKIVRYMLLLAVGAFLGALLLWVVNPGANNTTQSVRVINAPASSNVSTTPTPANAVQPGTRPFPAYTATPPAPGALGTEYMALGDSVAYGVGAPNPVEQGYAGLLYNNYFKRAQPDMLTYRNYAVPGETSSSFISSTNKNTKNQLNRALDELDTAAKEGRRVSPISLTIGGNDMLNARGKPEAERQKALAQFEQNYAKILDALKAKAGDADIFVTTYYNPYAGATGGSNTETAWLQRFNDAIVQGARARGVRVVDFYQPVVGNERTYTWIGTGDVHPNSAGHNLLARMFWQASAYDKQAPRLSLTYSPIANDGKLPSSQRLVFKVGVQDDWGSVAAKLGTDLEAAGVGTLQTTSAWLNEEQLLRLTNVPTRFTRNDAGVQEFSLVLDTGQLAKGSHTLRFEATDSAGNTGKLDVTFELG
jgi:lysophospholipase L1-like esterase